MAMLRGSLRSAFAAVRSAPRMSLALRPTARLMSTHPSESFLSGTSSNYVEGMYAEWQKDRSAVHKSWDLFFQNLNAGQPAGAAVALPKDLVAGVSGEAVEGGGSVKGADDFMKILLLMRAFQIRGHYLAQLDPLGLYRSNLQMDEAHEQAYWNKFLAPETYGFSEDDLNRRFAITSEVAAKQFGLLGQTAESPLTLQEIIDKLKTAYCGHIGVEFMHITDTDQQSWIREKFERRDKYAYSKEQKMVLLDRLAFSENFEKFLAKRYTTSKRFGLEGAENLIPGMKACIDRAVDMGCESVVIGMPHRGRLNVLCNVLRKPMEHILYEFHGGGKATDHSGSGDVKYHLGMSVDRPTNSGGHVHLALCANPSHLEAVNPIVEGKVRAKQFYFGDHDRKRTMPMTLHGDAAFCGQGVVFETMELSDLHNYTTGGTIHIVVNNQVGFTTDPRMARSSAYCSDVAKAIMAPIFHVNGDDAEAVQYACEAAAEYRQKFGKSVVVDIVCYRRHGHNEIDEPSFTQPKMYTMIKKHPTPYSIYANQLVSEGVITKEEGNELVDQCFKMFDEAYALAHDTSFHPTTKDWFSNMWRNINTRADTSATMIELQKVGHALSTWPENFNIHSKLKPQLKAKAKMMETGEGVDWGTAEGLAFGTLLCEGHHVRLSGQDVERGTFSHRHAAVTDQKDESQHVFVNNIEDGQAYCHIANSSLSEYAVLGFELGYSMENPNALILWEAQFGDFANGAQIMIDQFVSSMEQKWGRQSSLVMLLPHGFEGQGPEHSSARLERFLQSCDDDPRVLPKMVQKADGLLELASVTKEYGHHNWCIANVTTPANYFHLLRRQVHSGGPFRKPLVVMAPKSLLRSKQCVSPLSDFAEGSSFHRGIGEVEPRVIENAKDVKRLIFSTGKVYYDLANRRAEQEHWDVALCRVEQISPFPSDFIINMQNQFPNAHIVWAQEEPMNMGAWTYVAPRIERALEDVSGNRAKFIGRSPAASPATGSGIAHNGELEMYLGQAFNFKR